METGKTLYLLSLGCPKNRVDSEIMLGSLLDDGYTVVEQPEKAEVILINSCAFIGEAKQESIEAQRLVSEGALELNLVAQDLTAYGHDLPGKPKLHQLLQALEAVPARWIRLHYAYPRDFPDDLIEALAGQPNVARYLDMPLQHIADPVLRRMKRGRDSAWVRKLVRKLRDRIPHLTFRTSFIVGFPGETEAQFEELCEFVEEMRFDKVGVFQFSREEGTESYQLDGQLPQRVKASRQKKLLGIQRRISKEHQQNLVGRTLDVLVEGVSDETDLLLEGRWM